MSRPKTILVAGATGKQGRAVIRALLRDEAGADRTEFRVLALTRDTGSNAARSLVDEYPESASKLTLVRCDLNDEADMRDVFQRSAADGGHGVWGVFSVLPYPGLGAKADGEERQGKMLADLALEFKAEAFIYSSVVLSDPEVYMTCDQSHVAKSSVEKHCHELGNRGLNFTILRPGFFMEVFDGFTGSVAVGVFCAGLAKETQIPLVASEDIGNMAAAVFRNHERFRGQTLSIASELSTITDIMDSYHEAIGRPMPAIPAFLAHIILLMNSGIRGVIGELDRGHQARRNGGGAEFDAQVGLARSVLGLQTYSQWKAKARQEDANEGNWNQVSVLKMLTARS